MDGFFIPLTNDKTFFSVTMNGIPVYPGARKSYNRQKIILCLSWVPPQHSRYSISSERLWTGDFWSRPVHQVLPSSRCLILKLRIQGWTLVKVCFVFQKYFSNFFIFKQSSGQLGINYAFKTFKNAKDRDKVLDVHVRSASRSPVNNII